MIEDLKPYPEYKESGQEWLGQVPGHWAVRRIKFVLREVDARSTTGREQLLRVSQYTGVTERKSADGSDAPDTRAASLKGYKIVRKGDLVINIMLAWNGSLGVSRFDGIVSPAYCVYRLSSAVNGGYCHELLRLPQYKGRIKAASTGVVESRLRLYSDDLGCIEAPLPPLAEQAAIGRFLDHWNGRLEKVIRAKRRVIALLQEQKQAIIHRAVTRGLDPNVKLKDSGIPWLGEIPEHWEVRQVKRVASFVTSGSRSWANFYSDDGLVFIQSGNLGRNMALNFSRTQHVRPPAGAEGERTRVNLNDVLVCITGALTGNIVHVDQLHSDAPSYINQHIALVRPRPALIFPRFLAYALRSEIGQSQFKTSEYGGTKQGLGLGDVKDVFLSLPSMTEQIAIVRSVDSSLDVFTTVIARYEREITLLREYRTRLTADVVTGKVDVRAAAAQLPELGRDPVAAEAEGLEDEPEEGEAEEI
jgi:type I restriction enzyme S subunit